MSNKSDRPSNHNSGLDLQQTVDPGFFISLFTFAARSISLLSVEIQRGEQVFVSWDSPSQANVFSEPASQTASSNFHISPDTQVICRFSCQPDDTLLEAWHDLLGKVLGHPAATMERELSAQAPEICPSLIKKLDLLRRYANSAATIFISGDSGSGKTFLAHLLHDLSTPHEPCIELNLAAIPEGLLDLELFGHSKGAFTDASQARPGKLQLAGKGTLILDGLEALSFEAQAKLEAAMQHRSFYPLGADHPESFQARLLVVSRMNGPDLVRTGMLREDLFYLINVLPVRLDPLAERPEDIPFFIELFRRGVMNDYGQQLILAPKEMDNWLSHPWPGNIHELLNALELSRVQSTDNILHFLEKPNTLRGTQKDLKESVNQYKKKLIHDIVRECGGNQTKAARTLGIQRTYLSRLIKELSIPL